MCILNIYCLFVYLGFSLNGNKKNIYGQEDISLFFLISSLIGASLVLEDRVGRQPAHLAAIRNHKSILEFLYEKGVDLECTCDLGKLPLHYAAQHGGQSLSIYNFRHFLCVLNFNDIYNYSTKL